MKDCRGCKFNRFSWCEVNNSVFRKRLDYLNACDGIEIDEMEEDWLKACEMFECKVDD